MTQFLDAVPAEMKKKARSLETPSERRRVVGLDVVRSVAVIGVIGLHTFEPMWRYYDGVKAAPFALMTMFFKLSVPALFIVTGMLLIPRKSEPFGTYLKRRFSRILPPLLLWSVAYQLILKHDFSPNNFVKDLFIGDVWAHFWFLYALIALYLVIPVLRYLTGLVPINLLLGMFWISGAIATYVQYQVRLAERNLYMDSIPVVLSLAVIGAAMVRADYTVDRKLRTVALLVVVLNALIAFASHHFWGIKNITFQVSVEQLTLPSMLLAWLFVDLVRKLNFSGFWSKIAVIFAKDSFGIYLVHWMILVGYKEFFMGYLGISPSLAAIPIFLSTIISSWLLIHIISKIPVLRLAVGE